jgi:hypothetical protein
MPIRHDCHHVPSVRPTVRRRIAVPAIGRIVIIIREVRP